MSTSITSTTAAQVNPAITSKQVIMFREANLGFEGTVSKQYYDEARVGTTIKWSLITTLNSGTARTKSQGNSGNDITYDANTETAVTLTINTHKYTAFELEQFEESLSIVDLQAKYTEACSYNVNVAIDASLAALPSGGTQTQGTLIVDLTDDDVRRGLQYLEDANAPGEGRFFEMSPATKNSMLSIDRYASSDFTGSGGSSIVKGEFGDIYGLRTWQSTNIKGSNSVGHDNAIHQRDAFALGMRVQPHTQTFDDIQNLARQIAVSAIWGVITTRNDHLVWMKGA